MQESKSFTASNEINRKRKGSSKMAELIALHRVTESKKPESEHICYDPYAVHFVDPNVLAFVASNPDKPRDMSKYYESLFLGLANSIRARIRYFDDFVRTSINEGLEQLVILVAGYDTRAYRIEGLKDKVKVFEVDHPDTQCVKLEKLKEIFGILPDHVIYVPVDFETDDFGERLVERGYDRSQKTLFVLEGLIYYLSPKAVDELLSFIAKNSGVGSAIVFDYVYESSIDRTDGICGVQCTACDQNAIKNTKKDMAQHGEPYKFGIKEGMLEAFITHRGFSQICNVTSEDYKKAYFQGINEGRPVCCLSYFAHAMVE